ncbi:MAG: galactose mutarotase [Sedimentisphaerales bacterium]|nr:galactose mutarotase [Sedimentisphaerales bacterium]
MAIEKGIFGSLSRNRNVEFFILKNKSGTEAKLISFGATLISLKVPDKNGVLADIVLGYDDFSGYLADKYYLGCTLGRFANRIANAKFKIDDAEYKLIANDGHHHLNGGIKGFNRAPWLGTEFEKEDNCGVVFKYSSPDGEEGYPGNLDVEVMYTLTDDDELRINYTASCNKKTIVNLTNHSCFNLIGHNKGGILSHQVRIDADEITVVNSDGIPTGQIKNVIDSEFDLTRLNKISENIGRFRLGYDFNYILNKTSPQELSFAAEVIEPRSGRVMRIYTTEPAVQFSTGNLLNAVRGKEGAVYNVHAAFCIEPQHYPDSPNQPDFPSVILNPGEFYRQLTTYKFSAR